MEGRILLSTRPRRSLTNPNLQRPSALNSKPRSSNSIWLDKNENLDPTMLKLSAEILDSIPNSAIATYPESAELYQKLAKWVGVDPLALLLTAGSDGAIRLTFEAFVEDGDYVLHTKPTFAMYQVYSQMFGASAIEIEYSSLNSQPFLNLKEILDSIKRYKPKLVCLPNPDSPTGTILSQADLKSILTVCEESETLLLVDEAYHPFYHWSIVPWINESKNLVVARTFAKAWGAAGLRIGYLVGHPEIITLIHKMRPMYEVSTIAVEFMSRMLDKVSEMEDSVSRIQTGKNFFREQMKALRYKVLDTEGNFIHVAFGSDYSLINAALTGHILYRGSFEHKSLEGYSRFTVAPIEIMSKVVDLIQNVVIDKIK